MKKVYLLGFIMAATAAHMVPAAANTEAAVAVAPAQPGCPKAFQGFHLGGNIGYDVGFGKAKFSDADADGSSSTKDHRGFRGVDGGIGVGYTHRLCNWAVGLAFDANWANTKGTRTFSESGEDSSSSSSRVRLKNSLDLYVRLGYVLREIAMPFVGLGWENARWEHRLAESFSETENGQTVSGSRSKKKHKRLNSFLWKAGVDFLATKHVVVGFEYTGVSGGSVKSGNSDSGRASFKPQNNKFALTAKIVY